MADTTKDSPCRGNLEAVHPRALVLHLVRRLLDVGGRYSEALESLRRHRVDLNLLVDHDPEGFFAGGGAAGLVRQVRDPQRLCLLVADLR